MNHRIFLILVPVLALVGVASSGFAQADQQRILSPAAGVCPGALQDMMKWAQVTTGYAAFALPSDPNVTSCDDPDIRPVNATIASQSPTMEEAVETALSTCEANRAVDLGKCVVIGTARSE